MAGNRDLSNLELMPIDMQTEIISRVARHSRRAVRNLLAAVPPLARSTAVPIVYRNLNIHPLTVHPRAALQRYQSLMENCLASGNLQAHYVRGIQQYFHHQNVNGGLLHLQIAAEGLYEKAVYLYGVIMLAKGETAIGQAMLDTLGWRQSKNRADRCWRRVKRSLHGIRVTRLESYMTVYHNTRETIACHRENIHERCDTCYYYKKLTKFVYMM
ncbi:unnamed protein product [Brassica rapa]|uniref:At2g35280-like TPR domain-containing protein n=1 Tax=Brassica campestris TaxID=3711 RepID=A0A3P6AWJ4_BRACM|nr:unnamed protein product [Brassica rapa]VDC96992.1 unnamed protein product [Brassica rapa]